MLSEFQRPGLPLDERHLVLLTDGAPTLGCLTCESEAALARQLGVAVHTIYVGDEDYPEVLERLAEETSGVMFRAWNVLDERHADDALDIDNGDGSFRSGGRVSASWVKSIHLEQVQPC